AWTAVLVLAICVITFVIFNVVPQHRGAFVYRTEQTAADVPRATRLEGPVYRQFAQFMERVFAHGSVGWSVQNKRDVSRIVADALPVTASLVIGGAVVWLLIAFPLGILSALRPRSLIDRAGTVFVLIGLSLHPVSLGLILSYLLGYRWH